ncbi:MAG: glycosyltransferase family 1 protein [Dehalococcoidia bacterium]|nr:MAG: glycosyltransferase family 1 protein [Dehalococcoidia bacterium]
MKLLVCTQEYPPRYSSGIGNVVYNVVTRLQAMGVDCTICSPTGPDITLGNTWMIQKFGILGLLYYWYQVVRYFKQRAEDYDMVWLNNPFFIRSSPFKKSLITIHGTYYGMSVRRIYSWYYHLLYKISSQFEQNSWHKLSPGNVKFTAVSNQAATELEARGIDREKITYIPNGVNVERFKPADDKKRLRGKFNLSENDIIVLSLGRLTEQKEPYRLIRVFSLVEKEIKDITVVIAGVGELLSGAQKLAQQQGLNNVRFLGYVDHEQDAPDLYAGSDYFAVSSKYEGGEPILTLAEAMASGLPSIASDIPHFKIIEEANCGIIVDYKDEKKAARKIIDYLTGDNSNHSQNARQYAIDNVSWETLTGRYLEEFKELA